MTELRTKTWTGAGLVGILGVAVCLSGCAAKGAGTGQGTGSTEVGDVPMAAEPLGISLSWDVSLDEAPSTSVRDFLDVADHPNELYPTLNRIMDEAAAAVADELPASEAVRWVLTAANPRLTPDHKLHLTLLHFDVLNVPEAERKVSPVVKLSAFLSRIGGGEGLLMSAITVSSSRVLRGQGEKSPLDLAPFYSEIVAALRSEIETTQAR